MATERIPFVPKQESGSDPLSGASPIARNVVFDAKGSVRRRPVIVAYDEAPSTAIDAGGIVGLHVTADRRILAVGAADPFSKLYQVGGGNARDLSPTSTEQLTGGRRPIFAETEAIVAIAAGQDIQKVVLDPLFVSSRLGGTPPRASHVIAHRSRLLANNLFGSPAGNLNFITYSDLAAGSSYAGHEIWLSGTSGDFSADARPGPVVALWENSDEVFAFSEDNLETFTADPTLIYVRSLAREYGCIAPYSVARVDHGFAWLDHARRFVYSDGRSTKLLSVPSIQQDLADIEDVSDCFGYRIQLGAVDAIAWKFPSDGRTLVYSGDSWSQWSGFGGAEFIGNAFAMRDGNPIVGTTTGRVGRMSATGSGDFDGVADASVTTGFITHGTALRKHCQGIRVMLRRGNGSGGELHLAYRDSEGPWSSPLVIEIGTGADRDFVVRKRSLGTYRGRQWRATFSGEEDFLLVGVEEDFAVQPD